MRDVGQILLDDGSAFRELWSGMNPPRDENGGGGSGTTSRRHSVSVVQSRRPTIVGFNAPSSTTANNSNHMNGGDFNDFGDDDGGMVGSVFRGSGGGFGRGGLLLTDEDLADDLNGLNLGEGPSSSSVGHHSGQTSQPSSLPAYAHSRSPPSAGGLGSAASYQALQLNIPGSLSRGGGVIGTPSDTGTSPALGEYLPHGHGLGHDSFLGHQHIQQQGMGGGGVTPRYIPGLGIQVIPNDPPLSPTSYARHARNSLVNHGQGIPYHSQQQQQSMFTHPLQRRTSSDFSQGGGGPGGLGAQGVHDLGKGVPLHSVGSCPLFIVEFKAGRTDLFYAMDGAQDIRFVRLPTSDFLGLLLIFF